MWSKGEILHSAVVAGILGFFDKDPRVKFVGTVYDQELLKYIKLKMPLLSMGMRLEEPTLLY